LSAYSLLLLSYKPVQYVTVLNTVRNCNSMASIKILYYNIITLWDHHRHMCGLSLNETSLCGTYLYHPQYLTVLPEYWMFLTKRIGVVSVNMHLILRVSPLMPQSYGCCVTCYTMITKPNFKSGNSFCRPWRRNVSIVLRENGPLRAATFRNDIVC